MRDADRRREAGFRAQPVAAGDKGEVVRAAAQFVGEVGDQIVEPAVLADQADQRLARHGFWRGEDGGFDPSIHSRQRAAGGRSASSTSRASCLSPPAAARRGAHRPYSRNVGRPGKLARGAKRDQPVEQPAGGAVGHRRLAGRFGGGDAILGEQQVDDFCRRFGAQFGRDGEQGVGAARQVGGEIEGGGRGQRDRAGGGVCPGGVAGSRPRSRRLTAGSDPEFWWRSAARAAASAAGWRGRGRTAIRRGFRLRRPGRPGRRRPPEQRSCPLQRPDRPPLRKPSDQMRGRSGPDRARSSRAAAVASRSASKAGGRPARSRHSDTRFAAGPSASPTAKRRSRSAPSSAFRRRILAEAAALFSARRLRSAPAQGGSWRRKPSRSARAAPAANQGSPSPALPLARAQAGIGAGGKACVSGAFALGRFAWRSSGAARQRVPQGPEAGRRAGLGRRESLGYGESLAALCHGHLRVIRPACRSVAMSDKVALSDMIRKALGRNGKGPKMRPGRALDPA